MPEEPKFTPPEQKFSRREFLRKSRDIILDLTTLGFLGLVESDASEKEDQGFVGLTNDEIRARLRSFSKEIKDPHDYLRYLGDRECVVANEIMDAFAKTVDKTSTRVEGREPLGGYLAVNLLDTKEKQQEFSQRLGDMKLSQEENEFYQKLFSSSDLIIFRASFLESKFFLKGLEHERVHKDLWNLNDEEFSIMKKAAEEIAKKRDGDRIYLFLEEERTKGKDAIRQSASSACDNWQEFYPYLVNGDFGEGPENLLAYDYPEAYQIFKRIKESCKIKK